MIGVVLLSRLWVVGYMIDDDVDLSVGGGHGFHGFFGGPGDRNLRNPRIRTSSIKCFINISNNTF
jgi:hypothetical protein